MAGLGRAFLVAGAVLLLGTAALHALGRQMVAGWMEALPGQQSQGLQLVWLTDSLSWVVAALIWIAAARRPDSSWRAAAMLAVAIPLLTGAGIVYIDPTFFGGFLLLASGLLAAIGAVLTSGHQGRPPE